MQEREVTAGQETYKLPEPFFVIATQNPIEQEGTYPLPEAQLDRFMFNDQGRLSRRSTRRNAFITLAGPNRAGGADEDADRQGDPQLAETGPRASRSATP